MSTLQPPDPPLSDGVISLRPPDQRDLGAIERGINDRDVVRWFGRPTMSAAEVLELDRGRWLDGSEPTFAITEADLEGTDASAGACIGLVWINVDRTRQGSIGYWLLPEARGRGLATNAVLLIANWAVRALDLDRVRILVEPENERSQRVAENSGFRRQGVLPDHAQLEGRSIDHVLYVMPMESSRG